MRVIQSNLFESVLELVLYFRALLFQKTSEQQASSGISQYRFLRLVQGQRQEQQD